MKIIEPIQNLGNLSTNNAPIDQLDTWEPIGRDLLAYIEKPIFDIVDNTMVAVSSTLGGNVYKVDLSTGIVSHVFTIDPTPALMISISPNAEFFNVVFRHSTYLELKRQLVRIIDAAVIHEIGFYSGFFMPFQVTEINDVLWSPDSSVMTFMDSPQIWTVNTSTGVETFLATLDSGNVTSLIETSTHYFMVGINSVGAFQQVTKVDKVTFYENINYGSSTGRYLSYNPIRDEILTINDSSNKFFVLSQVNLGTTQAPSNLYDGTFLNLNSAIKITPTHLIARSLSSSPYWNYHTLADYSKTNPLPALTEPGEGIAEATDYTVIQQSNGIALLDDLYAPITQTNPSVVAGDSYIYLDKVYEVLIDNNDQPDEGALLPVPSWLDAGFINPLRLFDGKLDSLTVAPAQLVVDITPAQVVTGIALFNVNAAWIRVTMTDPVEGLVFDTGEVSMIDNSTINDWWAFYFSPYIEKSDFVSLSLPPYADATIQVAIDGEGGAVAVGEIVVGRTFSIGITQFGSGVGILDFSEKEQDQFGSFNILERKFSKRAEYDVKIPTNQVSGAQRTLSKFRTTPIVWVGDVNREETIIYGYYKSFDIVLSNPALSDTAITVEGL